MKKILALALAAALTAALAVPALAASKIDFSGYYKVRYLMEGNYLRQDDSNGRRNDSDNYFNHRLRFNVTVEPTEFITLNWRFEAPNNARWGEGTFGNFETKYIYADIATAIGTVKVGRVYGLDKYGLSNIGYEPYWGEYVNVGVFENDREADGIGLVSEFDNGLALKLFYGKIESTRPELNGPYPWTGAVTYGGPKDQDYDQLVVEPSFRWETGAASLALIFERNMLTRGADLSVTPPTFHYAEKDWAVFINPAVMNTWGPLSAHLEGKFGWGKTEWPGNHYKDSKREGYAFYADVDYNYGPGNVTLAGWYTSGNRTGSSKDKDLVKMGENFYPFVVAYNAMAAGYSESSVTNRANLNNLGHWAVAAWVNHSFTDEIAGRLAVGYFGNTDDYYRDLNSWHLGNMTASNREIKSDYIGVEIDAGLEFQLMENLTLETTFGYMINGDYYRPYNRNADGKTNDPDGTYTWANCLTIQF